MPCERSSSQLFRQVFPVGHQHPALPGGQVLVGKEAEAADSPQVPGARPFKPAPGAWAASSITARPWRWAISRMAHPAGVSAVMHHDDRLGARGDQRFDICRRDRQVIWAKDVGKAHLGAGVQALHWQ